MHIFCPALVTKGGQFATVTGWSYFILVIPGTSLFNWIWSSVSRGVVILVRLVMHGGTFVLLLPAEHLLANSQKTGGLYHLARPRLFAYSAAILAKTHITLYFPIH